VDSPNFKRTNMTEVERTRLLDKLDMADQQRGKSPRRATARLEYRVRDIPLSVNHPGGGMGRYIVLGRNLSSGGISLLHSGYLHNGTECRMALTLPRGGAKTLIGKVVFCRLAAGTIHEIGVQFSEKIDLNEFASSDLKRLSDDPEVRAAMQPLRGNVLLVAASEAERRLLEARLKQSGLNPTVVDRAGAAVDQVKLLPYSVAVIDLNLPDPGAAALVESLTAAGFLGSIVGLAGDDSPTEFGRAVDMGMQGCIMKPVRHEAMHTLLSKVMRANTNKVDDGAPITSALAGESGADDLIQFFLSASREAAVAIETGVQKGDIKAVRKECHSLKSIAGGYGFQSVAESARQVMLSLDSTMSLEEAAGRITALLNVLSRLSPDRPVGDESEDGAGDSKGRDGSVGKAA
jgi:DNA-binding NarL/FixJ family response regulator